MTRGIGLAIAAVLALVGCDQGRKGADGHAFGEPDYTLSEVTVRLVLHDDVTALRAALPAGHLKPGHEAMAWGRLFPAEARCEVHIVRPDRQYLPEWLGHEVTHCFHGRWHD